MVAFHNGHKLNRKSHWLGTDPKAARHTSSTATTMGEQRQQQLQQRVKLGVHFVLSRGGGDRSKEATASMQSPSLRCYINLIQKRRHAAQASYSWVYSYVNDGSRRSWRRRRHFKNLAFLESIVSGTRLLPARGNTWWSLDERRFLHTHTHCWSCWRFLPRKLLTFRQRQMTKGYCKTIWPDDRLNPLVPEPELEPRRLPEDCCLTFFFGIVCRLIDA